MKDNSALTPGLAFDQPLLEKIESVPGLDVLVGSLERLMNWASTNSFFVFPMATSCCGIELMTVATGRFDVDRMGAVIRATPRHCDVMVVAGTITVKMAPRVKKLWDQMPEPKWCIAMGSCAISGDFYRDIYSVVPGIDTFLPVDVYIPGCPPNPDALYGGLMRLQDKIRARQAGTFEPREARPETAKMILPAVKRLEDGDRDPLLSQAQLAAAMGIGLNGRELHSHEQVVAVGNLAIGRNVLAAAYPQSDVEPVQEPAPQAKAEAVGGAEAAAEAP